MSFDPIVLTSTTDSTRTTMPHIEPKTTAYRNKTWRDAEGQKETAVRLERLPPNLLFPEDFPEPITYDPGRHQLKYRGLMFSGSYTYLRQLSHDPAYLAALDQLFIGTSSPASRSGRWALLIAAAAGVALTVFATWWFLR